MNERLNWLALADKFAQDGDPRAMRACARELFELNKNKADVPAIMAEAALYLGKLDEAETLANAALELEPHHLRGRLILGAVAAEKFDLNCVAACWFFWYADESCPYATPRIGVHQCH